MRIRELTPAQRALLVRRLRDSATQDSVQPRTTIPVVSRAGGPLPVSFEQQRLWVHDRLEPNSSLYTIAGGFYLMGPLSVTALEQSLNDVVQRHEILRTTIDTVNERPMQVIASCMRLGLARHDLTHVPAAERDAALQELSRQKLREPFDLRRGPLLRCVLVRLTEQTHVLHVTMHHIIADDWSLQLFAKEISLLYHGYSSGVVPSLPPMTVQYADYAVWQRESLQGNKLANQLAYWEGQMKGTPATLELATDYTRSQILTHEGAVFTFVLPPETARAIKELSYNHRATMFMTLLAGFAVVLHRRTGESDIVIGTLISNRNRPEIGSLIGFFGNTLPLRINLAGNPSVHEVLDLVRDVTLGAHANRDVPFEQIVERAQPQRSRSHTPLFRVAFTMQHAPKSSFKLEGVDTRYLEVTAEMAKFELALTMTEIADGRLVGSVEYNRNLFKRDTIQRTIDQLMLVLQAMADNPECSIASLPLLTQRERELIVNEWNNPETEYPRESCVHELFEEQVRRTPQSLAIVYEDERLTYVELNRRANQLAHYLRGMGVKPDMRVAICMDRECAMIVGLLGILKAGGAYVPLDPAYPEERLWYMLQSSGSMAVLTQGSLLALWNGMSEESLPVIDMATAEPEWQRQPESNPDCGVVGVTPRHLAYVIYTSGSTGLPKATEVPHRSIPGFIHDVEYARFGSDSVCLQHSSVSWDALTLELWPMLLTGGQCVLHSGKMITASELRNYVHDAGVNTLWLTAALFNSIVEEDVGSLRGIRDLMIGGEALSVSHVRRALAALPETRIVNGYGPSECTVFSNCYVIPSDLDENAHNVPIGSPIGDRRVYILDTQLSPVPVGVVGELYIGGASVARGYLNRVKLTAEWFVPDPYGKEAGARMYRTGDLGRWLEDGTIEFLGRNDYQVKIRGFRIELQEIEATLARHAGVGKAVVVALEEEAGEKRLVAYYTGKDAMKDEEGEKAEVKEIGAEQLRRYLMAKLPEYMVPAAYVRVRSWPLTRNGKLDRSALPAPEWEAYAHASYEAPQGKLEKQLAEIWADVLKVERVGRHDNFFELGGHSILAVEATSRASRAGLQLSPVQFLRAQTIANLAATLHSEAHGTVREEAPLNEVRHASPLIVLQPLGDRQPFFCVHPGPGSPLCYMELALSLGQDQPFYGLQARGLTDQEEPLTSIEEMSALYIEAIQQLKPAGPYILGGHSLGAYIAFEMAQQLRRKGFHVPLLVIMDSAPPVFGKRGRKQQDTINETKLLAAAVRTVERFTNQNLSLTEELLAAMPREDQFKKVLERLIAINVVASNTHLSYVSNLLHVAKAGFLALEQYEPTAWEAPPIALFRASELNIEDYPRQYLHYFQDSTYTWDQIFPGRVECVVVPGDHITMLRQPNVDVLAECLKRCLDRYQQHMVNAV